MNDSGCNDWLELEDSWRNKVWSVRGCLEFSDLLLDIGERGQVVDARLR